MHDEKIKLRADSPSSPFNNNQGNCKALTLRLKAMNKYNITHKMYMMMENVISNLTKS